jgi:hypothetical protein
MSFRLYKDITLDTSVTSRSDIIPIFDDVTVNAPLKGSLAYNDDNDHIYYATGTMWIELASFGDLVRDSGVGQENVANPVAPAPATTIKRLSGTVGISLSSNITTITLTNTLDNTAGADNDLFLPLTFRIKGLTAGFDTTIVSSPDNLTINHVNLRMLQTTRAGLATQAVPAMTGILVTWNTVFGAPPIFNTFGGAMGVAASTFTNTDVAVTAHFWDVNASVWISANTAGIAEDATMILLEVMTPIGGPFFQIAASLMLPGDSGGEVADRPACLHVSGVVYVPALHVVRIRVVNATVVPEVIHVGVTYDPIDGIPQTFFPSLCIKDVGVSP